MAGHDSNLWPFGHCERDQCLTHLAVTSLKAWELKVHQSLWILYTNADRKSIWRLIGRLELTLCCSVSVKYKGIKICPVTFLISCTSIKNVQLIVNTVIWNPVNSIFHEVSDSGTVGKSSIKERECVPPLSLPTWCSVWWHLSRWI